MVLDFLIKMRKSLCFILNRLLFLSRVMAVFSVCRDGGPAISYVPAISYITVCILVELALL
jgi:hypothetical protein